jgi:hypothetical protein
MMISYSSIRYGTSLVIFLLVIARFAVVLRVVRINALTDIADLLLVKVTVASDSGT